MNNNRRLQKFARGLICVVLALLLLPIAAFAQGEIDAGRVSSLTVECEYNGQALGGVVFDLYKAADVDASGNFTPTEEFSGYSVSFEQNSTNDWRALALTLAQYALRDGRTIVATAKTEANGQASFEGLGVGMYLVYGHLFTSDDFSYEPEAFLVSLPNLDQAGKWYYDVKVNCKGEGDSSPSDGNKTLRVLKIWDDVGAESNRPEAIEIELLCDGQISETVTLNAENNWRHTWTELSKGHIWTVAEKTVPEGYVLLISKEGGVFLLTNTYRPTASSLEVTKVWDDKGYEKSRPQSVEVQLLCDGEEYEKAILNAENSWSRVWNDLEDGHIWSIKEVSVPKGYKSVVTQNGTKFIVTNTYKPYLPQTGQLWWPIPVLLSAALLLFLIGLVLRRSKSDEK